VLNGRWLRENVGWICRFLMTPPPGKLTTLGALDAFTGGIGFVITTPGVWLYSLVPAFMLVLLWTGLVVFGVWGATGVSTYIFGPVSGTWSGIGKWTLIILLSLVALLVALLLALLLAEPASGFALERISQAQERKLTGHAPPTLPLLRSIWLSTRAVTVAIVPGGVALLILLAVNLVYPPALVVTVPLKILVCAWMLAWDFLDYPLGLRGLGIVARLRWVGRNFGAFTLFGVCWALFAVVPGAVLMLLPMGVAGATRMVLLDDPARSD
jgi:CysZ protein